jgi:hypothetical protein
MTDKVYGDYIAEKKNWQLINHSIPASCNRRIIRSTIKNIEKLLLTNKPEDITCIIQLTNQIRGEVWVDGNRAGYMNAEKDKYFNDSPKTQVMNIFNKYNEVNDGDYFSWSSYNNTFFLPSIPHFNDHHKYSIEFNDNQEQFFYDLFADSIMLESYLSQNNIKHLIFYASIPTDPLNIIVGLEWLEVVYKKLSNCPTIMNMRENNGSEIFLNWAWETNQCIFDRDEYDGHFGHPDTVAHELWADVLLTKLKNLYAI